jgi:hypothetical protein
MKKGDLVLVISRGYVCLSDPMIGMIVQKRAESYVCPYGVLVDGNVRYLGSHEIKPVEVHK